MTTLISIALIGTFIGFIWALARILGRDSRDEEDGTLYCADEGALNFALVRAVEYELTDYRSDSALPPAA